MSEKQLIIEIQNGENIKQNMEKLWLQYQPLIKKISHRFYEWTHDYDDYLDFQNESYFVLDKTVRSIDLNRIDNNFHIVNLFKQRLNRKSVFLYEEKLKNRSFVKIEYNRNGNNKKVKVKPLFKKDVLNSGRDEYNFDTYVDNHAVKKGKQYYNEKEIINKLLLDYFKNSKIDRKYQKFVEMRLDGLGVDEYNEYRRTFNTNKPVSIAFFYSEINRERLQSRMAKYLLNNPLFCEVCNEDTINRIFEYA